MRHVHSQTEHDTQRAAVYAVRLQPVAGRVAHIVDVVFVTGLCVSGRVAGTGNK